MSEASQPSPWASRVNMTVPYLTTAAHFSGPFISTFLLIHLSAPVMANLGGSSLASQTMLLGREYYQTTFGEKYLVLGPIAIHTLSAALKRIIKPPRRVTSVITVTGYAAMFLFLPVHFITHRTIPASSSAPILELGPSELDYEFVKFGLQNWPWRSTFLYGGLVLCVGLHMVDGTTIIFKKYMASAGTWPQKLSRKVQASGMLLGMFLPVMTGLAFVASEPAMIFSSMAKRFDSVFSSSLAYRL